MVSKISTALAAALVFASVGAASAQPAWHAERVFAPNIQRYDGVVYPHETERYCYMPLDVESRILQQVSPCDNEHRVTN